MKRNDSLFEKTNICKNCGSEKIDHYCSNCGQKVYVKRFTLKSYFIVFLDTFNIEKGIIHTLIMLFTKPGIIINDYLKGKTKPYLNPLKYVLIIGGIFAFLMIKTDIIDVTYKKGNELILNSTEELKQNYNDPQVKQETLHMQQKFMNQFKQYINIIPFVIIPFFSLISLLFYRSKKLVYGEFLIINSYIFAQTFIITVILLIPLVYIIPVLVNYFPILSIICTLIYFSYALYKTFKESIILSFIKALFIYILGTILFWIFLIIVLFIVMIILSLLGIKLTELVA